MKYAPIVFMQDGMHDAEEALFILDDQGEDAAIEYLQQWDSGEYHEQNDKPGNGTSDTVYRQPGTGYRLTYNLRMGYIGLEMEIAE